MGKYLFSDGRGTGHCSKSNRQLRCIESLIKCDIQINLCLQAAVKTPALGPYFFRTKRFNMGYQCIWFYKDCIVLKGIKAYAWPTKRNCSRFINGKQFCCGIPDFSTRALPPPYALVTPEMIQQSRSDEILMFQRSSKRHEDLL